MVEEKNVKELEISNIQNAKRNNDLNISKSSGIILNEKICRPISRNMLNPNAGNDWYGISLVNNHDGTYHVYGTSTSNLAIRITTSQIFLEANKSYTSSIEILDGEFVGQFVATVKNDNNILSYNYFKLFDSVLSQTKISNENKTIYAYEYYLPTSNVTVDFTFRFQVEEGSSATEYEAYEGCLYGLELYDTIEENFITDNYYLNCGIIAIFFALIILIVNAPLLFIRKIKGNL